MSDQLKGQCPMGCGDTLFVGSGGYVTCSWHKCPNPTAVADLQGSQIERRRAARSFT